MSDSRSAKYVIWSNLVLVEWKLFGLLFLVCCLVVGSGEKWNKGIDRYEVGMLCYRQKSR